MGVIDFQSSDHWERNLPPLEKIFFSTGKIFWRNWKKILSQLGKFSGATGERNVVWLILSLVCGVENF